MHLRRNFLMLATMLLLAGPLCAQVGKMMPASKPTASAPAEPVRPLTLSEKLAQRIAAFEKANNAIAGFAAIDLTTGRDIFSHRAAQPLIPASNMKLYASCFALIKLGANHQFTTSLYRTAGGDLVIIGGFDPLFGDPYLEKKPGPKAATAASPCDELDRWAKAVVATQGRDAPGSLILRTSFATSKDFYPPTWAQRHKTHDYAPPIADLNFHVNTLGVSFRKVPAGLLPVLHPASRFIKLENRATAGKRHLWRLSCSPTMRTLTVRGTLHTATRDADALPCVVSHPPMFLGRVFLDRLDRAGGKLPGKISRRTPGEVTMKGATLLASSKTPIRRVLRRANQQSLNLAAECLLLAAGDGTWPGSGKLMNQMLCKIFRLDPAGMVMVDGSGLSRANRVTAASTAKMLAGMHLRPSGPLFQKSLAVAGKTGTLRKRLRPLTGRVLAKTGYLSGCDALSGYLLSPAGKPRVAFSVLINNVPSRRPAKALQQDLLMILDGELHKKAKPKTATPKSAAPKTVAPKKAAPDKGFLK